MKKARIDRAQRALRINEIMVDYKVKVHNMSISELLNEFEKVRLQLHPKATERVIEVPEQEQAI